MNGPGPTPASLRAAVNAALTDAADAYPAAQRGDAWEGEAALPRGNGKRRRPSPDAHDPLTLTPLALVRSRPLEWLWPELIPLSKIVFVDGDPDLGKSTLLLDLAARVSRDGVMPTGVQGVCGNVLLFSAEDDPADTIRPRLEAAGADLHRCYDGDNLDVGDQPLMLPQHLFVVEKLLTRYDPRLVIFDPFVAYLDVEIIKDNKVRAALRPLKRLLQQHRCTAICLRHLNKGAGTKALYRGGGSIGLVGASRAALLVARDPDNERYRVLAQTKGNLGPRQPSLRFCLDFVPSAGACRVEWSPEPSAHTADSLLQPPADPEEQSKRDEAVAFLRTTLEAGPMLAADLYAAAKDLHIRDYELRRAKAAAGATTVALKDPEGKFLGWQWRRRDVP